MKFDDPDGGVWKQGWDVTYDKTEMEQKRPRLEVVVVPHSHCDPGTFKHLYHFHTKSFIFKNYD